MKTVIEPIKIDNFGDFDQIFEEVWELLQPYFISSHYFGHEETNEEDKIQQPIESIPYNRSKFCIDDTYKFYIKVILKKHCIITALEKAKMLEFENQYVSMFHLSMLNKDLGFFAVINNVLPKEELLGNKSGNKNFVDQLMKKQLIKKQLNHLDDTSSTTRYERSKLQVINGEHIQKSANPTYAKEIKKEANSDNMKALRFRKNKNIQYTYNIIDWKDDSSQYISFYNSDLVYSLINSNLASFEKAVSEISEIHTDSTKNASIKVVQCLKKHLSLADLFKGYDDYIELRSINGEKKKINYDIVDTIILNHSLEKYYHMDLLCELLKSRRELRNDKEFYFDNSVYDDILIKTTQLPITFSRVLFIEFGIRARNFNIFFENIDESKFINIHSKKMKRLIDKKLQQLTWVNLFEEYIEQLSKIFFPLLEKLFIASLYAQEVDKRPDKFKKYNTKLINLLYKYIQENISNFIVDPLEESSFNNYKPLPTWSFPENGISKKQMTFKKENIKAFGSSYTEDMEENEKENEIEFLKKFYSEVFTSKNFMKNSKTDIFNIYNNLCLLENPKDIECKSKEEQLSREYRKERAALDSKYLKDMMKI